MKIKTNISSYSLKEQDTSFLRLVNQGCHSEPEQRKLVFVSAQIREIWRNAAADGIIHR